MTSCENCVKWKHIKNQKTTINDIIDFINLHHQNSKVISNQYTNNKIKLEFVCEFEHYFSSKWNHIREHHWCPTCRGGVKKYTQNDVNLFFERRGEKCLDEYTNSKIKLRIKCQDGHIYKILFYRARNGSRCYICNDSKNESLCRMSFEYFTNKEFKKVKIIPNLDPKNYHKLELDGYSNELNLAFEYQGEQHFIERNDWSNTRNKLNSIKKRDDHKRIWCKNNNIKLIEITYQTSFQDIPLFIKNTLNESGFDIKKETPSINDLNLNKISQIKKCVDHASSKDGKFLSIQFLGAHEKHWWECKYGHKWKAEPNSVINIKTWCPICAKNYRYDTKTIEKYITSLGSTGLFSAYINRQTPIEIGCPHGIKFLRRLSDIQRRGIHTRNCIKCKLLFKTI